MLTPSDFGSRHLNRILSMVVLSSSSCVFEIWKFHLWRLAVLHDYKDRIWKGVLLKPILPLMIENKLTQKNRGNKFPSVPSYDLNFSWPAQKWFLNL
jgi:hypothetical protein